MSPRTHRRKHRKAMMLAALGASVAANAYLHHEGYSVPGRTPVRCSRGHEFRTFWVVGASLNSLRLGPMRRFQRCPECRAWRLVKLIKPSEVRVEVETAP